jgi:hypothetical protein
METECSDSNKLSSNGGAHGCYQDGEEFHTSCSEHSFEMDWEEETTI